MANHASHAALPYPIRGARYTLLLPYLDADGDPTDPTTPDTEYSLDDGAAADTAEEVSSPKNSVGMLTLTGAETNGSCVSVAAKAASGPKTTLATLYPRVLPVVASGTSLDAGSSSGGTIASGDRPAYDVTGCFVVTTGGTGGGGTGGANNQARRIVTYAPSTGAFTVSPNLETAIDTSTDWEIRLPEGATLGMLRALNPSTPGRTLDADASGRVDVGKVAGTAQTARDLGAQLDATVSSRLAAASYTAPLDAAGTRSAVGLASANLDTQLAALPTAAEVRAEIDTNSVGLAAIYARTDVATSTRLAGSTYVAPLDATATQAAAAAALTAYDPPTRTEATSDKDAILARLGSPANADLAADIAAVLASIALRATPAQVATEIADALRADSGTELSSPPAKDAPVAAQVQWLFQALRNGGTQTATARTTRNDAGSTTGTQAVSDDGTTLTVGKAS